MRKKIISALNISVFIFCAGLPLSVAETGKTQPSPSAGVPSQILIPKPAPMDSSYSYNPVGKPDPFKPFVEEEIEAKKKEVEKKAEKRAMPSIYPLQRQEVDKFRIVGIVGDENRRIAVAEDASKKYYPLVVGTHIGLNNGKVTEILSDRVIVEEYEAKKVKKIILRLRKN